MAFNRAFMRKWVPIEVYPIMGIVGVAVSGASYFIYRCSQGSEVVWNRKGDWRPWDKVKQDHNMKFLTVNRDFWEKRKLEIAQAKQRIVDQI